MIVFDDPSNILRLADFGIGIPLLDTRPRNIIDRLQNSIPSRYLQQGFDDHIKPIDLARVHSKDWIDAVLADDPTNAVCQTFELIDSEGQNHRYDPDQATKPLKLIAEGALRHCSGAYEAARLAQQHGFAYFLGGGMHHAMETHGAGFCMLNDVVVALRKLQALGQIKSAWVIDVDVHKGDGTAQITQEDLTISTLSIHMKHGWPLDLPKEKAADHPSYLPSNIDIGIDANQEDVYLKRLEEGLERLAETCPKPDIIAVVNGSDPFEGDELPSSNLINLSLEQMMERDQLVYQFCRNAEVPQFWLMAGGYGSHVWQVHAQFLEWVYSR